MIKRHFGLSALLGSLVLVSARAQITTNVFTVAPAVSTNLVGTTLQLTLLENGLPPVDIVDYQWSVAGTNLVEGGNISGVQTPILTITAAQLTNSGTYTVSLSITGIVQVTAFATVYIIDTPAIQDVITANNGAGVTFTVLATGGLLAYQWLWQGQPIASGTNSALVFPDAYANASAGYYTVIVTNQLGAATSAPPGLLFTKPTPTGTYQGIFFDDSNLSLDSSGFFQYTLSATKRSFSGRLNIGIKTYPFSGTFSLAHDAQIAIARSGLTPLLMQLQLVTLNNAPQVIGSLTDGNWVASLSGNRLFFTTANPTSLGGKYTLALQNTNASPLTPNGDCYGTVIIRTNGNVVISGMAGDGTFISQSCGLSRQGDWPLYVSLTKGRGRLLGWLRVNRQGGSSIQGTNVFWLKGPGPDKLYPDGFTVLLQPTGSSFTRPTSSAVLASTNRIAAFSGGDLFFNNAPVWDFVKVALRSTCTFIAEPGTENLHLSANCANGLLTGQFTDFATGLHAPIRGILLQQQNLGSGFFLSTNSSGHFSLGVGQ